MEEITQEYEVGNIEYIAPELLPDSYDELIHMNCLFLDRSFNPRDDEAPPDLVDDIRKRKGYIYPIIVFKYSDTRYGIGGGWQRVDAGVQIGYTVFPCKIFDNREEMLEYLHSSYLQTPLSNLANVRNIMILYKEFDGNIDIIAHKFSKYKSISIIKRAVEINKHFSLLSLIARPHERDKENWRFIYDIGGRDIFEKKGKSLTIEIAESLAVGLPDFSEVNMGKIAILLFKNKKSYGDKIDRIIDYIASKPDRDDYKTLIAEYLNIKKKRNIVLNLDLLPDDHKLIDDYKREMRVKSDAELIIKLLHRRLLLYKSGFIGNPTKPFKEFRVKIGTQEILVRKIDERCKVFIFGDNGFHIDYWIDTQKDEWNNNIKINKPVKAILNSLEIKY